LSYVEMYELNKIMKMMTRYSVGRTYSLTDADTPEYRKYRVCCINISFLIRIL